MGFWELPVHLPTYLPVQRTGSLEGLVDQSGLNSDKKSLYDFVSSPKTLDK